MYSLAFPLKLQDQEKGTNRFQLQCCTLLALLDSIQFKAGNCGFYLLKGRQSAAALLELSFLSWHFFFWP